MAKPGKKHLHDSDSPSLMPSPADFLGWVLLFLFLFAVYAVISVLWNTMEHAVTEVQSTTKQFEEWSKKRSEELLRKSPSGVSGAVSERTLPTNAIAGDRILESFKQQLEKTKEDVSEIVRGEPPKKSFDHNAKTKE